MKRQALAIAAVRFLSLIAGFGLPVIAGIVLDPNTGPTVLAYYAVIMLSTNIGRLGLPTVLLTIFGGKSWDGGFGSWPLVFMAKFLPLQLTATFAAVVALIMFTGPQSAPAGNILSNLAPLFVLCSLILINVLICAACRVNGSLVVAEGCEFLIPPALLIAVITYSSAGAEASVSVMLECYAAAMLAYVLMAWCFFAVKFRYSIRTDAIDFDYQFQHVCKQASKHWLCIIGGQLLIWMPSIVLLDIVESDQYLQFIQLSRLAAVCMVMSVLVQSYTNVKFASQADAKDLLLTTTLISGVFALFIGTLFAAALFLVPSDHFLYDSLPLLKHDSALIFLILMLGFTATGLSGPAQGFLIMRGGENVLIFATLVVLCVFSCFVMVVDAKVSLVSFALMILALRLFRAAVTVYSAFAKGKDDYEGTA